MVQAMNNSAKIFIIDDDPIMREAIAERLAVENYAFLFATNGKEALDKLDSVTPDLILLDVMMPFIDGYELCKQIKANKAWQHIPVILISALDDKSDLIRGLEAGADEFLTKPVSGAELRARVRSMLRIKEQYDALQKTLQLREDMVQMLVHDLRNPLSIIALQNGTMLMRNNLPTQERTSAEIIRAQIKNLEMFLNDMLLTAKMEHDQFQLNLMQIDMRQLAEQVVCDFEALAEVEQVSLQLIVPAEPCMVDIDTNLFSRVLDNLVSNAFKFSPPGGTVTVRVSTATRDEKGDSWQRQPLYIQVLDEGPGIPEAYHEVIFEKYETAPLPGSDESQIGLGLAFCKMVVEAHNGRITAKSNHPQGTILSICL